MNICPNCNFENRYGELICSKCREPLFDDEKTVNALDGETEEFIYSIDDISVQPQANSKLILAFSQADTLNKFVLSPELAPFLVGRLATDPIGNVDINLAPFETGKHSISRQHAVIRQTDTHWTVEDLRSTNGTYLNGRRIVPDSQFPIFDGDQIRFGKILCHVRYSNHDE